MTHRRFESDYTPQIFKIMEYSDDFIRELFNSSNSQKEVLEKINRKPNGSGWRMKKWQIRRNTMILSKVSFINQKNKTIRS